MEYHSPSNNIDCVRYWSRHPSALWSLLRSWNFPYSQLFLIRRHLLHPQPNSPVNRRGHKHLWSYHFLPDLDFQFTFKDLLLGFYLQNVVQLGTHTDVFEQLGFGQTMNSGLRTELNTIRQNANGPKDWIDSWTMFYWGMWIGWSPFVGNARLAKWEPNPQSTNANHFVLYLQECSLQKFRGDVQYGSSFMELWLLQWSTPLSGW